MFEGLFRALFKESQELADERKLAQHLAKVLLYELKGIDSLYPDIKGKAQSLQIRMMALGKPIVVTECFRSAKVQQDYYVIGRRSPGSIVTNAQGLQSYHQYGLAFDVRFKDWDYLPPLISWWEELGKEGEKLGLIWGGRFNDRPHFEWHPNFTWKELQDYFKRSN